MSDVESECKQLWLCTDEDRLGNGARAYVSVHRLVNAIKSSWALEPPQLGEIEYEVSDLCHHRFCRSFDHLVYEPKAVNSGQRSCKINGFCHCEHLYGVSYANCRINGKCSMSIDIHIYVMLMLMLFHVDVNFIFTTMDIFY